MSAYGKMNAFPLSDESGVSYGLTKREYFVAAAMEAIAAFSQTMPPETIAKHAIAVADATLAELEKD